MRSTGPHVTERGKQQNARKCAKKDHSQNEREADQTRQYCTASESA
jgi:hypothetical protein